MHAAALFTFYLAVWATTGSCERPLVSFVPNWNRIFTGESITMTCHVDSAGREDLIYYWYNDNLWVHTGKSYTVQQAQESHSGNYQCQTSTNERSDAARLDVHNYHVILRTPLYVYEGENVTLGCHHYPGYYAKQTIFYKGQEVVQDWGSQAELLVQKVDMKSIWRYSCTKQVYHNLLYYQHSDEVAISVQELFMAPVLKVKEDGNVTCDTSLAPLRRATELQFAFYRNGQKVQNFSLSNRFTIPPAQLKTSAAYKCKARTSTNTVEKTSGTFTTGVKMKGHARRPVVSFIPNWNKIFTGESITMTCDVESAGEEDLAFYWSQDGHWAHTGKSYTIQKAEQSHSGNYQCQTSTSEKSDSARLDVHNYHVILQTPVYVYEGDNVTLRCHHYPGYTARQVRFSKGQDVVQAWGSESELLVENVDMKSIWKYTCSKEVYHNLLYYQPYDEVTISVQELFMPPVLRLIEGDNKTLMCDTSLAPLRQTTQLQFAFYRNGRNVQEWSPADRFSVHSGWLRNSGTYVCQVRTPANTVMKSSGTLTIEARM